MRSFMPKFQSCRLIGVVTIEKTYDILVLVDTHILPKLGNAVPIFFFGNT